MTHYRAAKRYAKAFMLFLSSKEQREEIINEIKNLNFILSSNRKLRVFLKNPVIDEQQKLGILMELFKPYSTETKKLVQLIIRNGRSEILPQVVEEVITYNRREKGIKKAIITSAQPLSNEQNDAIKQKLLNLVKANDIEIESKIDPSLLGGFKVRIEDLLFDASVQSKLDNLKKEFNLKNNSLKNYEISSWQK